MRCAIISPGNLPVPAVKGGAVEVLIEELINSNEKYNILNIDLYTLPSLEYKKYNYSKTKIIQINSSLLSVFKSIIYKVKYKLFNIGYEISLQSYAFGYETAKKIKKKEYDYILIENNMVIFDLISKESKDSKLLFHLHNDILCSDRPYNLCKKVIEKSFCILTVSNYLKNRLKSVSNSNNIEVLYNCVDLSIFKPNVILKEGEIELKKKYNISSNDYVFAFTGRIDENKGIVELIESFKDLRKKINNIKLIVVGKKDFNNNKKSSFEVKLENLVSELNDDIIFTGFVEHNKIPEILSIVNCIVIPSKWEEPFGVVALEAMAMKKVIIATKSGGLVEPLTNDCAIIINKDNLKHNLVKSMEKVIRDKELCSRLSSSAYKRVKDTPYFNSNNYFLNFINIINLGCFENGKS